MKHIHLAPVARSAPESRISSNLKSEDDGCDDESGNNGCRSSANCTLGECRQTFSVTPDSGGFSACCRGIDGDTQHEDSPSQNTFSQTARPELHGRQVHPLGETVKGVAVFKINSPCEHIHARPRIVGTSPQSRVVGRFKSTTWKTFQARFHPLPTGHGLPDRRRLHWFQSHRRTIPFHSWTKNEATNPFWPSSESPSLRDSWTSM